MTYEGHRSPSDSRYLSYLHDLARQASYPRFQLTKSLALQLGNSPAIEGEAEWRYSIDHNTGLWLQAAEAFLEARLKAQEESKWTGESNPTSSDSEATTPVPSK